ncbi:hypothetical protein [Thioclava kandeliae]|uniref:Sialate O-acetylesterase domain-containing protein n=1 Tax=Thioclava kandeliae TaxID=3070818 RepID=A0ABV1SIE6_9RHOB
MAILDDINAALRDFQRYTGDGLPNEPAGAPLPVGDPTSGRYQIQLAPFRDALVAILQTMGDEEALQEVLEKITEAKDRANHTGTQEIATIDGLQSALDVVEEIADAKADPPCKLPRNRHGLEYGVVIGDQVVAGRMDNGKDLQLYPVGDVLDLLIPNGLASMLLQPATEQVFLPRNRHGIASGILVGGEVVSYIDDDGQSYSSLFDDTDTGSGKKERPILRLSIRVGQSGSLGSRGFVTYVSDGNGGFTEATVFSSAPEHGDLCLMLDGSGDNIRTYDVLPVEYTGLAPAFEKWDGNVAGETGGVHCMNRLMDRLAVNGEDDFRLGVYVAGVGASMWSQNGPGTPRELAHLAAMRAWKSFAERNGWKVVVGSMHINHGENPASGGNGSGFGYYADQYLPELTAWRDFVKSMASETLNDAAYMAPMFVVQFSRVLGTLPASSNEGVAHAQLVKHITDPYFCLYAPRYVEPYYDGVHMRAEGYVKIAEREERAQYHWLKGRKWQPLMIISATLSGTTITLTYNNTPSEYSDETPGPVGSLVLDAENGKSGDGNGGFLIRNGGDATITGVTATGNTVTIELSEEPDAGAEILYAIASVSGGQLRDSDERDTSDYDDSALWNWAVGQVVEIDAFGETEVARWDVSDLTTLWDYAAGRYHAGAVDAEVGRVSDLGGSEDHLTQSSETKRPVFAAAEGIRSLTFDGVDDSMEAAVTLPASHVAVIAVDPTSWTAEQAALMTLNGTGWALTMGDSSSALLSLSGDGITTITGDSPISAGPHVFTVIADADNDTLKCRVDGVEVLSTTYTTDAAVSNVMRIMGSRYNSAWIAGSFYFAAIGSDISTAAVERLEAVATKKIG